ncbi:MAG: phage tail assembly chaperone [Pseudomonadota bacterium]
MSDINWPALLQLGLGRLGLRPAEFWDLTPAELSLMAGVVPGAASGFGRSRLEELAALYPDDGDAGASKRGGSDDGS